MVEIFEICPRIDFRQFKSGKFAKCQIFMIFVSSEIKKIDLETLFFRIFKIPTVKICPVKNLSQCRTDFTKYILCMSFECFTMDEKILIGSTNSVLPFPEDDRLLFLIVIVIFLIR